MGLPKRQFGRGSRKRTLRGGLPRTIALCGAPETPPGTTGRSRPRADIRPRNLNGSSPMDGSPDHHRRSMSASCGTVHALLASVRDRKAREPAAETTRPGSSFWSLAPSGALLDRARDSRLSYRKWVGARCCGSRGPTAARHSSCAWARACSRGRRFWGREAARRGSPAEGLWQGADVREGGGARRCIGANRKDASNPRCPQARATRYACDLLTPTPP